jgi:hypothetical protein
MQELFRYDESWTGTEGSGGSGHSAAQEDAALVEEGFEFEGPFSLMVSVNESYAVVLEGQEEGELRHEFMGVYERVEGKEVNGRGVWQALGGVDCFLYYWSSRKWMVSYRKHMEAGDGKSCVEGQCGRSRVGVARSLCTIRAPTSGLLATGRAWRAVKVLGTCVNCAIVEAGRDSTAAASAGAVRAGAAAAACTLGDIKAVGRASSTPHTGQQIHLLGWRWRTSWSWS